MTSNLRSNIIRELKEVATVDVVMSQNMNPDPTVITINDTKMSEIMAGYDYLATLVNKTWSNLPSPPVKEKTHVFVWLIISEGYCVNHSTIKWPGSSPNTFVHLWSIMDRIKSSLTGVDSSWLIGSRDCVQFCSTTGLSWPMDSHMYPREQIPLEQITKMEMSPEVFRRDPTTKEFSSFYNFQMTTYTPKKKPVLNISRMGLSDIMKETVDG